MLTEREDDCNRGTDKHRERLTEIERKTDWKKDLLRERLIHRESECEIN